MTREQTIAVLQAAGCNEAEVTAALASSAITLTPSEPVERDVDDYVRASVLRIVPDGEALAALYGKGST